MSIRDPLPHGEISRHIPREFGIRPNGEHIDTSSGQKIQRHYATRDEHGKGSSRVDERDGRSSCGTAVPQQKERLAARRRDLGWGGRDCGAEVLEEFVRRRSSLEA